MSSTAAEPFILALDSPEATLEQVGGKGASLARLVQAGLPVPPGFHITTQAYRQFVNENRLAEAIVAAASQAAAEDPLALEKASAQIGELIDRGTMPGSIAEAIRHGYAELGADEPAVAVRSSATAEDLPGMSFAGQQETYLNVRGSEQVLAAVKRCWASLWTARAIGYRARQGISSEQVALAVVVQQLVPADAAGILFTANPVTGARDEIMINAAWGLGEAIVGGEVTPDRWVIEKSTGAIRLQEVADKEVMTVRSPEGTRTKPVHAELRRRPALEPDQVTTLARLGLQVEALYGLPMDLEWAIAGGQVFLVQARPITALPEPRPRLEWILPNSRGRYARSSVIELLPEPLSPLFASLAVPVWNRATVQLAQNLGMARALPEEFLITINDYAYYDCTQFATVRGLIVMPGLIARAVGWLRRAHTRWADEARPRYQSVVASWAARSLDAMPASDVLAGPRAIVAAAADHYLAIQSGILPVAYMTETVFTSFYNTLVKRTSEPPALVFLLGFDSAPMLAEKSLYDLAAWSRGHAELAEYLARTAASEIAAAWASAASPVSDAEGWRQFCQHLSDHLDRFGHAIYDLDFAKSLPVDDPAPLLEALKYDLSGTAPDPYQRQTHTVAAREAATQALRGRLRGLRRRWFNWLLRSAQRYAPLREDALADVGLGWPQVRRMLLELGGRLVAAGALADRNDVFWLRGDEAEAVAGRLDAGEPVADYQGQANERRARWELERKFTPPVALPVDRGARFFGIDFSRWMPARTSQAEGTTIRGVGTSPGRVAGLARVLRGPSEFGQMRQGEILVAKITTPAWTPLFALAAGVVTDVGGPLSHGSIVAREYRIPAVLGTGVATERIQSGQRITVDGDDGVVTLAE